LVGNDPPTLVLNELDGFIEIVGRGVGVVHRVDVAADVHGHDVGAFGGEPNGMGAALPSRRAGDERHPSVVSSHS